MGIKLSYSQLIKKYMKNNTLTLKLLILLFAISTSLNAQENIINISLPETVGLSSDSLEQMNIYFHSLVDEHQLAGIQTAIMRHGKLIHFDNYGYSNIEEGKLIDENSIF